MSLNASFGYSRGEVRRAECTVAESVGDFVCIVDDPPNGYALVGKADPANYDRLPAVGVVIGKSTPTECLVQWIGETPNIFSGLASGEVYFLGDDSKPVDVPPVPVGVPMFAQSVAVATAPTRLYVKPSGNLTKRIF